MQPPLTNQVLEKSTVEEQIQEMVHDRIVLSQGIYNLTRVNCDKVK